MIGTTVGPYQVLDKLGEGGMGEVYRARDTRLKRDIALKVLPQSFAGDAERMTRLQREAEVLASLSHSNIAAIYGLEDRALVMELVEGRTLAESIVPGTGLPIDHALRIATQIADALEYAHERGVVHRDLKPANIKVTPDGVAKLLDFGLAKATQDPIPPTNFTQSPTIAVGLTQAGVILGTAPYMSPEQARGKEVDRRTDIWAFGVVLYELLTGRPTFSGDTTTDILASVVKDEPDWRRVPVRVRRLLRACLQKDPNERLHSITDWRLLLDEEAPRERTFDRRPFVIVLAAIALVSVGAAVWGWLRPHTSEPRSVMRFSVNFPELSGALGRLPIAPDGSRIAIVAGPERAIYVRALEEPDPVLLRGTEGAGGGAAFSPDGQSIAFFVQSAGANRQLKKVSVSGGGAITLADNLPLGAAYTSWEEDNTILYVTNSGVFRISGNGGTPQQIASSDATKGRFVGPQLLPGGTHILASTASPAEVTDLRVVVIDVRTGQVLTLLEQGGDVRYVPSRDDESSGYLVYGRYGALLAAPFDVRSLRIGAAASVLESVMSTGPFHAFNVSRSGTLVYKAGRGVDPGSTLMWKDRAGKAAPTPVPPGAYVGIRLSHDGKSAAVEVQRPPMRIPPLLSLGVLDLARGTLLPLTTDLTASLPLWSRDDRRLWFRYGSSTAPEVWVVSADGSEMARLVLTPKSVERGLGIVTLIGSPDGPLAVVARDAAPSGTEILSIPLEEGSGAGNARRLFAIRARATGFEMSPDGRSVAYQTTETGKSEVWVTSYPGPGPRVLVSTDGGETPRWNPKGGELFYRNGTRLMAVDIETIPALRAGPPRVLFDSPETFSAASRAGLLSYDVSPDGQRFLMIKPETTAAPSNDVHVVVNWADELARKLPPNK